MPYAPGTTPCYSSLGMIIRAAFSIRLLWDPRISADGSRDGRVSGLKSCVHQAADPFGDRLMLKLSCYPDAAEICFSKLNQYIS